MFAVGVLAHRRGVGDQLGQHDRLRRVDFLGERPRLDGAKRAGHGRHHDHKRERQCRQQAAGQIVDASRRKFIVCSKGRDSDSLYVFYPVGRRMCG